MIKHTVSVTNADAWQHCFVQCPCGIFLQKCHFLLCTHNDNNNNGDDIHDRPSDASRCQSIHVCDTPVAHPWTLPSETALPAYRRLPRHFHHSCPRTTSTSSAFQPYKCTYKHAVKWSTINNRTNFSIYISSVSTRLRRISEQQSQHLIKTTNSNPRDLGLTAIENLIRKVLVLWTHCSISKAKIVLLKIFHITNLCI